MEYLLSVIVFLGMPHNKTNFMTAVKTACFLNRSSLVCLNHLRDRLVLVAFYVIFLRNLCTGHFDIAVSDVTLFK